MSSNEHHEHRMRRAKSWHEQSKKAESDEEKFICLWIAFNAAYGGEPGNNPNENEATRISDFLGKIIHHDKQKEKKINDTLNKKYKQIEELLDNKYIFRDFWKHVRGELEDSDWEDEFNRKNKEVWEDFREGNVLNVFKEVFWRLYQLRNQVFHGGVTFKKGIGRSQLKQGCHIMEDIVPIVLQVMEENFNTDWGKIAYPRVKDNALFSGYPEKDC